MTDRRSARVEVRRADRRYRTDVGWLDSWHSFAFGPHQDPGNTHHGLLIVNNDDRISPRAGFDSHPHRDMEIVTWVLSGSLVHQDSAGNSGVIYPGLAQRMSAGTGIVHSERNDDPTAAPVHLVQMWVLPDERGLTPDYEQGEIEERQLAGRLTPIASGLARHADTTVVRIQNRNAGLSVGRLGIGQSLALPDAPFVHLFIARGAVLVEGAGAVGEGDAVRFSNAGAHRVTASESAELLVWEMFESAFA